MISYTQLGYIFALLRYKNFQKAANACNVTQPTLSMQLKAAEEIFGFKIINRDAQPIALTQAGEKLFPALLELQGSYDNLSVEVQKLKGLYKAEIRVGLIPTISNYLVPDIYANWQTEIVEVSLDISELVSDELVEAIKNRTIDFGIMAGPLTDDSLEQQILYNEEIHVYAPSIAESTIDLSWLTKETPWLLGEGNCLRTQMVDFCQLDKTLKYNWNYEGGNLHLLTKMVEQEGGYTLIPHHYLSVLNINPAHLKKIKGITPIRQVIGIHLKRNSNKAFLNKIMHIVQRNKNNSEIDMNNAQLLPWKT